jgi:hypothetical protein
MLSYLVLATKTLHAPLLSLIHATYPIHLILLHLITQILFGEEHTPHTASHYVLFSKPVTPTFVGPYIFLSTLFLNTLSLCSYLSVSGHRLSNNNWSFWLLSLPISRQPSVLMNVSVQEHCALNNYIFDVAKLHFSNTSTYTFLT